MPSRQKLLLLGGACLFSTSFAPAQSFAPAALAMLDPSARAAAQCGGKDARIGLAHKLRLAALAAGPAGKASSAMPLYTDLANHRFPLTSSSDAARRFFSQGLLLNYGFNHAGAVRSFREAQRIDPGCALCWWGEAIALGPNINAPMDDRDRATAFAALEKAQALADRSSPLEQALIEALSRRYSRDPKADRGALDGAYADAMLDVARRFPADNDVAVLAAEAVMDTSPWNYWEADKKTPIGRSGEAVRLIETVFARDPSNLQAAHLLIHMFENSANARRAEAAADRLSHVKPLSAGHLVHMPSHIYNLVGRHTDSIRVNIAAARADEAFIKATDDKSLVRYGYYPHNIHFIVISAQMAGDMPTAIREAKRLRAVLDVETSARIAWIQAIDAAPYLAMAQFAEPGAILAMPPPDVRLPYPTAMRHYARAVAFAQLKDRGGFDRELAALGAMRTSGAFAAMIEQGVPAPDLLALAEASARGRYALAQGKFDEAVKYHGEAVAMEGKIPYQEPPYWYYPANQALGAALFQQGKFAEASQAFRAALLQAPENGWALYGLARSEQARGRSLEAAAARAAFNRVWLGDKAWLRMERL